MIEENYPLSPMQQGILFHSLYEQSSGVYIEQVICSWHENVNVSNFIQSWQRVVERHSILRTGFDWDDSHNLQQSVYKQVKLLIEQQDWQKFSLSQQSSQLNSYLQSDRQKGFNIAEVPLMRLALFQLAETDYKLVWTFHHALLDGRSIVILLKEVFSFYEVLCQNQELKLEPAHPYGNYIDWLGQQSLIEAEKFWKQQLQGFQAPTQLLVGTKSEVETKSYNTQKIRLSQECTSALQDLAQENELTLNTLLQGAWALLLSRYSGQEDIVFGATRACRRSALKDMDSMVGLFINTLPVRVQVDFDKPLLPWLKELREQWIALRDYEHTSLVKIQEWSEVSKGLSLFESLLVFENYELNANLRRLGKNWESREFELLEQPNYPLTLAVYAESELILKIDYDSSRFNDQTIARLLGHLDTLLNGFIVNSQQCLGELPFLTAAEKHQFLVEWNDTQTEFPENKCIHQLFEEQVERTPERVAVVFENQQLTYQELNTRANKLAHYLQKLGVGPKVLVGICIERSPEMLVSLLAILKAGGAYVPLDPNYPTERLAHLLSDSGLSVLLTQEKLVTRLPENKPRVMCLDADWEAIIQESKENPKSDVKGNNLSYVIYTSGTTGQPKGVMIEHSSVINLAMALNQRIYTEQKKDQLKVSLNGSLAFDTSVKQIIQLLSGHTLEIIPEDLRFDGTALLSYLQRRQIDVFDCTPSQLGLLISADLLDSNLGPKCILVGGEPLNQSIWSSLSKAKHIQFFNVYGPTECTVDSTICDIRTSKIESVIGRPIANTQVYILNSQLQPVPIEVAGELHIGGTGLARGYLNRSELTAERFIPNLFSDEPNAKLYKTGDLARYLPDGNIEFIGRIDNQVKIRGFRIELDEIETVLKQHPVVRDCVVIVREDDVESKNLVAYVVLNQRHTIAVDDLRHFLKQKLPSYMIPSGFMVLETLPLTTNGKVDRSALPTINWREVGDLENFVAPRTPVEELLAGIWSEVLGLGQVGINDDFFDLGGHSLKATQVISRVRDVFSLELPIRCLFEFPAIADFTKHIENICSQESNISPTITLQPIPRKERLTLSFAQQRLWFLNQLEAQNSTYNILSSFYLTGTLNETVLQQSINEIVKRHEILRTTFSVMDGVATPIIHDRVNISISSVNLETLPELEQETEVQRLVRKESQRTFDFARDPLWRVTLLRLGRESYFLLLTIHHIVSDGWSMGILFRELSLLYKAFSSGESVSLPHLPIQYADFADWQRQWLQGEVLESQLNYWQQQLADVPPLLDLPTDRPRPPVQSFRGSSQTFELNGELTQELKKLSRQSGTTLFMTLLAVFMTLLSRYSHQEDIVVGTPIANRNRQEIESLIGFFVNTLVLRVDFSGNPSFRELLKRTRQVTLDAYCHQDLPFEKLVEELQPERNLSYNPLFQVMFVLQNAESEAWEFPGITFTPLEIESVTAKFDLTLAIKEKESDLRGVLEYNSDLFDETTISRMVGHLQTLLAGIVANPDLQVSELPLLTQTERHQLLVEWNDTGVDYPKHKCIHQLFEEQVEKTPNAVALVFGDQRLTYREVNSKANQLAHYLQKLGVKPETLVGICVERSPLMVIGLMGILKAGGAYVPLDPNYPQERLAFMLEDSQVSLLLTQQKLIEGLPQCSAQVVDLENYELWVEEGIENLTSNIQFDNLAYVLYTSGSTGKPKGVAVEHRSVVTLLSWATEVFTTAQLAGVLGSTSFCFDISIFELFVPLSCGGKIILAENVLHLPTLSAAEEVTLINTVPAAIAELVRAKEIPENVRTINLAGEALPQRLAQLIYQQDSIEKLFNLYGPSEDTVYSTYGLVKRDGEKAPPIGRPIPNTQVYILDTYQQPVPIGVPGELHLGGAGLTRGYLNRSDFTRKKFIPNPFSDESNTKLYKTGDLVRYLSDGNIEFIGRIDNQVKIRGFRIELGEIEAVLSQHPDVQETVVIAREDNPGNKHLVAYIIPVEQAVEISELRRFLQQKLPEYMIPSAFVMLETISLTPNGKIDRRALPIPDSSNFSLETNFVAPRTPTEKVLADIWSNLLGVEQIGINDNFFELGGHSLLAIQVIFQIQEKIHLEIPWKKIFELPNIKDICAYINSLQNIQVIDLNNQDINNISESPFPIKSFHFHPSVMQQRMWHNANLKEGKKFSNNICVAINLTGCLKPEILRKAFNEIVKQHEALRASFCIIKGRLTENIAMNVTPSFSIIDLSNLSSNMKKNKVEHYCDQERKKRFNLYEPPLMRLKLLRMSKENYILLFTIHHIIFDGWSLNILLEEVSLLYNFFCSNQSSVFSKNIPTYQFSDFVFWQKQILTGKDSQGFFKYWKSQLDGVPPLFDFPREKILTFSGSSKNFKLKYSVYEALQKLSIIEGFTLFTILVSAFKLTLYSYTKKEDILVATAFSNRIKKEFKRVIGSFNHTQILRTKFPQKSRITFQDIVNQVSEVLTEAYSNQVLPFALIDVERYEWNETYLSLLQVYFTIIYEKAPPLSIKKIKSNYVPLNINQAKFPLSLSIKISPNEFWGTFIYNNCLFSDNFIFQMTNDFIRTLEHIANQEVLLMD